MGGQNRKAHSGGRPASDTRAIVHSDGRLGGFELPDPEIYIGEPEWHPATIEWWQSWRESPQAVQMMTGPDWHALLETALIHHNMWKNGRWEFAGEVRQRTAKYGATPADRKALKIEVEIPEEYPVGNAEAKPENVASINERRKRLA